MPSLRRIVAGLLPENAPRLLINDDDHTRTARTSLRKHRAVVAVGDKCDASCVDAGVASFIPCRRFASWRAPVFEICGIAPHAMEQQETCCECRRKRKRTSA